MAAVGPVNVADESSIELKKFCLIAKDSTGVQLLNLLREVLGTPTIYVFGELLALPNVQELKEGQHIKYYKTLELFAYGTYKQYCQNPDDYIDLSPYMHKKLQQLTILSCAMKTNRIPYDELLEELQIDSVRHMEDIIIASIYTDIIRGKFFQSDRIFHVHYALGRDMPPGYTSKITETLQQWVDTCDALSNSIDTQINSANMEKEKHLQDKQRMDLKVLEMRKKQFKNKNARLHAAGSEQASNSRNLHRGAAKRK